jgi:hypothetical protein
MKIDDTRPKTKNEEKPKCPKCPRSSLSSRNCDAWEWAAWGHVIERASLYFSMPFALGPPLSPTDSNNGAHDEEGPREEGHSHR